MLIARGGENDGEEEEDDEKATCSAGLKLSRLHCECERSGYDYPLKPVPVWMR